MELPRKDSDWARRNRVKAEVHGETEEGVGEGDEEGDGVEEGTGAWCRVSAVGDNVSSGSERSSV
jgi:hypothetical protein